MDVKLENINVGISNNNPIGFILEEIELLNIYKISEDEADKKLNDNEIEGFIDDDLNLLVKKSGINQTIIKEIIEQIKQMGSLNTPFEKFDFTTDYIQNRNQDSNPIIIIFYSLIAMVSTYGVFAGIEVVSMIQANLTNVAKRINVTPLRKSEFLFSGVIISLILNLGSNILFLIFIKYILKINLFTEIKYTAIFIIIGNLFGISLGMLMGASNKKSSSVKTILSIAITLVLSFFSGMMSPNIKVMIDKKIPWAGRINPISIITNNLYKINLLGNTDNVMEGIFVLLAWCIVLIFISYVFLRGETYDSI